MTCVPVFAFPCTYPIKTQTPFGSAQIRTGFEEENALVIIFTDIKED